MSSQYDSSIQAMNISNNEALKPPQPIDYTETKKLFRDFRIGGFVIPTCDTLYQLLAWRKSVIDNFLEDWESTFTNKPKTTIIPKKHESATRRGWTGGRPRKITIEQFEPYYKRIAAARYGITIKEIIAAELKVSLNTVNRLIREIRTGERYPKTFIRKERPLKVALDDFLPYYDLYIRGYIKQCTILRKFSITQPTFARYAKQAKLSQEAL